MTSRLPELREYQLDAVAAARAKYAEGYRSVLMRGPTASGKTVIFCYIVASAMRRGRPTLVLAHRKELIDQASKRLDANGIDHGVIMAKHPRYAPALPVQVASVPTLVHRPGLLCGVGLIIVDEAHHCTADSYRAILRENPEAKILGVTATPFRTDGRGLGDVFETMVSISSIGELVERGYLVPPRTFAPPGQPNLKGLHIRRGDYVTEELEERVDQRELIGNIVEHWCRLARGRPTIAFAVTIAHSRHIATCFRAAGISCEHLDGTTPQDEREAILTRLAGGQTQVVSNVGVLTEGTDIPEVSAIINARPTKSLVLYIQTCGRGLRLHDTKQDCLILDHAGLSLMHGSLLDEPEVDLTKGVRPRKKDSDLYLQMTTCLHCYAVFRATLRACPNCGEQRQGALPLEEHEGELQEAASFTDVRRTRRNREVAKARTLEELRAIGIKRGYHPRWAEHVWRHRKPRRERAMA